jgi:hypothetical protein
MPLNLNEALEWLDRAEQAREVAWQLTDPGARSAVLQLAESYEQLARAAQPQRQAEHGNSPRSREAAAGGQVDRAKELEAEIDKLLREKEEIAGCVKNAF